jgi:hypothetical protein
MSTVPPTSFGSDPRRIRDASFRRLRARGRRGLAAIPWWGRTLLPLVVLLLCAPLGLAGTARAAPANAPNLTGAYVIGGGAALAVVGYVGWANVFTPVSNGTQVYANAFYIAFFNLRNSTTTVSIDVEQNGNFVSNTSLTLPPVSQSDATITLPSNTNWVQTDFILDGEHTWNGPVATPISFLPNYILNVGGLDLLALTIVSFGVLVGGLGYWLARLSMKRAVWAPSFRLIVWGHVVLAIIAGAVFLDFQAVDTLFAGWSPIVYPWLVLPLVYLSALSTYNRAPKLEIVQGVRDAQGGIGIRRTIVRVGPLEDGRTVVVGGGWGQFLARIRGHYPIIDDAKEGTEPPLFQTVENMPSPTDTPRQRIKARRVKRYPMGPSRITAFRVLNPQEDDVAFYAWTKTSEPVRLEYPHLSIHRTTLRKKKVVQTTPTGIPVVTEQERPVEVLTWPHYVDPARSPIVELHDRHYLPADAVWAGFASIQDLGRTVSNLGGRLAILEASIHQRVQDELYSKLRTLRGLIGRATSGASDEEAAQVAATLQGLLKSGEKK